MIPINVTITELTNQTINNSFNCGVMKATLNESVSSSFRTAIILGIFDVISYYIATKLINRAFYKGKIDIEKHKFLNEVSSILFYVWIVTQWFIIYIVWISGVDF
jgi:hypothetical protein